MQAEVNTDAEENLRINICDNLKDTSPSPISRRPFQRHIRRSLPIIDSSFDLNSIDQERSSHNPIDLQSDIDDISSLDRLHFDLDHSNQDLETDLHHFDNSEREASLPIESDSDYFDEMPHSSSRSHQSSFLNFLPSHSSFWKYVLLFT